MKKYVMDDGIEIELDDDVDPAELDQGAEPRDDDLIDWGQVAKDAGEVS